MTSILITGVAGFVGSNLAESLISKDFNVVGVDNFSTGKKDNLKGFIKCKNFFFKKGDITNLRFLKKMMHNVDFVFHYAALPSVPYSVTHPLETHRVNVDGTLNVLLAARDSNVKKVVFASSSAVYGNTTKLPIVESQELNPFSPYAAHKIIGENYCKLFFNTYGLRTSAFRFFNIFGPRQSPDSQYAAVIPKFLSLMKNGMQPIIFGDGLQTRDFVFVEDVVQANLLAIKDSRCDGQVFNVGSGVKSSVLDLVNVMNKVIGTNIKPVHNPVRAGDVKHSYADISKVKALGFRPKSSLIDGLLRL
ncbi:MAG: NAD-dependent epimerase/dehydratase family protein [Nanoarchaeota archaeon]|nr:NAD-dependent epimerase/dehydratase family protein [Nanoarchaeota archaeon]MBU1870681.1 NAD-dependent epimerase/dehydratase family protein [Patescibacteria group bacterium]